MVYTSQSLSLAILETLVHLDSYEILANQYCLRIAEFPESVCEYLDASMLPKEWNNDIPINATKTIGDTWLKHSRSAVLVVPSAIAPTEKNFLLNPDHPEFSKITIGPVQEFVFSKRFIK